MTPAHPALVTREAAARLPRLALLLFCAAYVLPGLFARDPWRGADINAFGQMLAIAEGRAPWMQPMLGGVPTGGVLLPHWIGALAIQVGSPWLDPALAARLPFALLLVLTLLATWYASFHLALSASAQPVPLAFGGEADPVDYARAVADGALLALIATLGLLQLGHETTPELVQLAAAACWLWAMAAAPRRGRRAGMAAMLALPALAASGAPAMALALGAGSLFLSLRRRHDGLRPIWPWLLVAVLLVPLVSWPTHTWAWRVAPVIDWADVLRLIAWFLWPSWLLAAWTLWRWRLQLMDRHLALPLLLALVSLLTCVAMDGSDRALMLSVPAQAVLAAFALPALRRSAAAAIDWFSVFFFSLSALVIWLMYAAMQTGVPAQPAANIARLAPGFQPGLSWFELLLGLLGTLAWLWLVRWRTGRHRAALWKSLVLPAGGVALCWLLLMTLWLPLLDYARSNRPLAQRVARHVPAGACVAAPSAQANLVVALEWHARLVVDATPQSVRGVCPVLVLVEDARQSPRDVQQVLAEGWREVARERRPTDRREFTVVYRRAPKPAYAASPGTRPGAPAQALAQAGN